MLLSAVLTQAIPDMYIPASGGTASIDLSQYFDDDEINGTVVNFDTVFGDFQVELFDSDTPATVQNFLGYVDDGTYDGSIIHRNALSVDDTPFVVQGGGFRYEAPSSYVDIVNNPPTVLDEPGISNTRGTIAMARPSMLNPNTIDPDDTMPVPDSATTEWFINMDNNSFLDTSASTGFTAFGRVLGDGMDVVDQIAATPIWDASSLNSAFGSLPLRDFTNDHFPNNDDLVVINSITRGGPELTYSFVSSSSPTTLLATVNDGVLTIFTVGNSVPGDVTIKVEAEDQNGNTRQGDIVVHIGAAQESIDSDRTPDLLWRNFADGRNTLWQMTGYRTDAAAAMKARNNTTWYVAATGDFNKDGSNDLLWRNAFDGQNKIWYMDGDEFVSAEELRQVSNKNMVIGGVADFTNDGNVDILWRNVAKGRNVVWVMDETAELGSFRLNNQSGAEWYIGGLGDFDRDGQVDVLWRNDSQGQNKVWLLNPADSTLKESVALLTLDNTNWVATAVADFNLDNQVDILYRNTRNGKQKVWVMDPSNGTSRRGDRNDIRALRNQDWQLPGRTSQLAAEGNALAKTQRIKRKAAAAKKVTATSSSTSAAIAAAVQQQSQTDSVIDEIEPIIVLD